MGLNDSTFIYCAYWTVMGRGCDPEGHRHFRGRLRRGVSKTQILWDLRHSPEGIERASNLPGLDRMLERHRYTRLPLIGPLFARYYGMDSQTGRAKRRRELIHLIQAVGHDLGERIERLELESEKQKRIERLEAKVDALEHAVPASRGRDTSAPVYTRQVVTSRARHLLASLASAMVQRA